MARFTQPTVYMTTSIIPTANSTPLINPRSRWSGSATRRCTATSSTNNRSELSQICTVIRPEIMSDRIAANAVTTMAHTRNSCSHRADHEPHRMASLGKLGQKLHLMHELKFLDRLAAHRRSHVRALELPRHEAIVVQMVAPDLRYPVESLHERLLLWRRAVSKFKLETPSLRRQNMRLGGTVGTRPLWIASRAFSRTIGSSAIAV